MNKIRSIEGKAHITFGLTKTEHLVRTYNIYVTYPHKEIYLTAPDIKACFRWPKMHLDLSGAFRFVIHSFYFIFAAMVFGSTTSASSWEPVFRAIKFAAEF